MLIEFRIYQFDNVLSPDNEIVQFNKTRFEKLDILKREFFIFVEFEEYETHLTQYFG